MISKNLQYIHNLTFEQQLELALKMSVEAQKAEEKIIYRGKDFKAESGVDKLNQKPNRKLAKIEEQIQIEKELLKISRQPQLSYYARDNGSQQIIWLSKGKTCGKDTEDILELYKKIGRKLHINTGIHGDSNGNFWGNSKFFFQDLQQILSKNENQFSFHNVSKESPPIFPKNIDVLNAWCHSFDYQIKKESQNEESNLSRNLEEQIEAPSNNEPMFFKFTYENKIAQDPTNYNLQQDYIQQAKAMLLSHEEIYKIYEFLMEVGCQNYDILKERANFINENIHEKPFMKLKAFLDCRNHPLYDKSFDSNVALLIKQIGYQALIEHFTKIETWQSYIYKGDIEMILKRVSDAISSFQAAQNYLDDTKNQYRENDVPIYAKENEMNNYLTPQNLICRKFAEVYFLQKEYSLAIIQCNETLNQNPKDKVALKIKGSCFMKLKQRKEAIKIFQQIHGLFGQDLETSLCMASIQHKIPKQTSAQQKEAKFTSSSYGQGQYIDKQQFLVDNFKSVGRCLLKVFENK